jgi:hypothetical protein
MKKVDLIKELTVLIDQFDCNRTWGSIEITFSDGAPVVVKKTETKRIEGEPHNANRR